MAVTLKIIWTFVKPGRGGQDTFASIYSPEFPSTYFGLRTTSVDIPPSRYSLIACACVRMNELKIRSTTGFLSYKLTGTGGFLSSQCM